ncbi:MAG: ERF family protein [Chloroflexi bacterium]|nr:ERF family protein [Chloroflexota bacterium]
MTIYDKIAKIQDEVQNITKDAKNSHFGNTYATYEQVMEVLHPILRKYDLLVCHSFGTPIFESHIAVVTTLKGIGESKDELSTTLHIQTLRNDPQAAGSSITYAKRYSILAMLGLGTEDDDGNAGSGNKVETPKVAPKVTDKICPVCKGKLVEFKTKTGKTIFKCENGKFENGVSSGCKYVDWNNPPKPTKPMTVEEYEDYQGSYGTEGIDAAKNYQL